MVVEWQYRKHGECDYCEDGDARLYTPKLPNLRVVVPPLFCPRCRTRFETLIAAHPSMPANDLIAKLERLP